MLRPAPDPNDPASLRAHITYLEHELKLAKDDQQLYHKVMGYLRDMTMEHGTCQPRSRRACTHCNAKDELERMRKTYGGPRIIPAGAGLAPTTAATDVRYEMRYRQARSDVTRGGWGGPGDWSLWMVITRARYDEGLREDRGRKDVEYREVPVTAPA